MAKHLRVGKLPVMLSDLEVLVQVVCFLSGIVPLPEEQMLALTAAIPMQDSSKAG